MPQSDIVARLRRRQAADEIERLREAIRAAGAALQDTDASTYQRKRKAERILAAAPTSTEKEG